MALSPGQRGIIDQGQFDDLERSRKSLEELPYTFRYWYRCDEPDCHGHKHSILDWEIGAAFRAWRARYTDEQTLLDKIHEKWFGQLTSDQYDTYFFVGNARQYPSAFMVLGVASPPTRTQLTLF